jgi:hypothetical protein
MARLGLSLGCMVWKHLTNGPGPLWR